MARARRVGSLRAEYCEGGGDWLPNFFFAAGRLYFGIGDRLGLCAGFGGGRWRYRISPVLVRRGQGSRARWALAVAWERRGR